MMQIKKRYIWITVAVVVIIIIGLIIKKNSSKSTLVSAYTVSKQDIKQTVVATGTVTSQTDLDLAFKNSGTIEQVSVSVGDKVKQGQTLMVLDQKDAMSAIAQAKAGVLTAQANYDKVVNGSSDQQIEVAQAAVDTANVTLQNTQTAYTSTVNQQNTLVANAHSSMLNAGLAAVPSSSNITITNPTVTGTYTGTAEGSYIITLYATGSGMSYQYAGLETGSGIITQGVPLAIGHDGLFINFASSIVHSNDSWTISVPNMQSSAYINASNAYQNALQTQSQQVTAAQGQVDAAQAALQQAQAALDLQQAPARNEDVESAQGTLANAQAALQTAQNAYDNDLIVSPIDGVITEVDGKIGQLASPTQTQVIVLDQNSLHVESDISESSIALVQPGQSIDMTFDAFGDNTHFTGAVLSIDPASIVISGVTDFRVVSSLPDDPTIKSGMSVNLTILSNEKTNTLAVPSRLIQTDSNGNEFVTVINGKTTKNVNITTGLQGDIYTEITSGLNGGESIQAAKTL